MRLTVEERVFVIETYLVTKSPAVCRQQFMEKFEKEAPVKSVIQKLVKRFRETGSVLDKHRDRQRSVLTPQVVQDIRAAVTRSPHKSLRRLSREKNISLGSAHTAVRRILKCYPYRMQVFHELNNADFAKRVRYCQWFKTFIRGNIGILDQLFFTDEAWFHLGGYVNGQNYRTWGTDNPHIFIESPLHPQKIGVWCAVSRRRIIGPLFFETTVNAALYEDIIQQFIACLQEDERYCWLQQDGATCHTARSSMEMLQDFFDGRIISTGLWPPRSPDLSSPDFFLWGYLKDIVYRSNPHTLQELKTNITNAINEIDRVKLKKVARNMVKRVEKCIEVDGQHFQHLL